MRMLVHGNYEGQAFVLRKEDGSIYQRILPDTIFGIGDFCSYFAKRIWWGGNPTIALIKLSSNMKVLNLRELKKKTRIQKGFILKPGKGLWAISADSARRGIWHLLKEIDDPILITLWSYGLPSQFMQVVENLDCQVLNGGNLCEHARAGSYYYDYLTDGNLGELRPGVYGKHVRGKMCQIREAVIQVIGGTYCIQACKRKENNGRVYSKVTSVMITAAANKQMVAKKIKQMMGH